MNAADIPIKGMTARPHFVYRATTEGDALNYRGALVVRVDAIRVLGEQEVLIALNRQPSALNSTGSMPTAHKFEGVNLGGPRARVPWRPREIPTRAALT